MYDSNARNEEWYAERATASRLKRGGHGCLAESASRAENKYDKEASHGKGIEIDLSERRQIGLYREQVWCMVACTRSVRR